MRMTKQEAIENHRKLWNWIADKTLERKRIVKKAEYFVENKLSFVDENCYCCEYDSYQSSKCYCEGRPIDWNSETEIYMCIDKIRYDDGQNLYKVWDDSSDYKERAKLARQIAQLPENPNVN